MHFRPLHDPIRAPSFPGDKRASACNPFRLRQFRPPRAWLYGLISVHRRFGRSANVIRMTCLPPPREALRASLPLIRTAPKHLTRRAMQAAGRSSTSSESRGAPVTRRVGAHLSLLSQPKLARVEPKSATSTAADKWLRCGGSAFSVLLEPSAATTRFLATNGNPGVQCQTGPRRNDQCCKPHMPYLHVPFRSSSGRAAATNLRSLRMTYSASGGDQG